MHADDSLHQGDGGSEARFKLRFEDLQPCEWVVSREVMEIDPEYIVEFAQRNCLTLGAAAIALAAESRSIAWTRLGSRNCLQLSQGSVRGFLRER